MQLRVGKDQYLLRIQRRRCFFMKEPVNLNRAFNKFGSNLSFDECSKAPEPLNLSAFFKFAGTPFRKSFR